MAEVKRYVYWCRATHGHAPLEQDDGEFVLYEDYERLERRYEALLTQSGNVIIANAEVAKLNAEQAETIERLRGVLQKIKGTAATEEVVKLAGDALRDADEIRPGPQGQDRREVGGSEPATPQRKSLESSPGLPTPPVSR